MNESNILSYIWQLSPKKKNPNKASPLKLAHAFVQQQTDWKPFLYSFLNPFTDLTTPSTYTTLLPIIIIVILFRVWGLFYRRTLLDEMVFSLLFLVFLVGNNFNIYLVFVCLKIILQTFKSSKQNLTLINF